MPTIEQARAWYPQHDPVHGFDHVLRVYRLAERLAQAEGADLEIVQAAALLHDAQSPTGEAHATARAEHHYQAAVFAGEVLQVEGWTEERIAAVQHAIRTHRFRDNSELPDSVEAQVLFDADKLDALGAIGVARAIAYAAQRGEAAYSQPSSHFLRTGETEPGEGHSAYHEYIYKLSQLQERLYTATGRQLAQERHKRLAEFFINLAAEVSGEI